jgi:hypothetical protein
MRRKGEGLLALQAGRGTAARLLLCDACYREADTRAAMKVTMVGQSWRWPANDRRANQTPRPNFVHFA